MGRNHPRAGHAVPSAIALLLCIPLLATVSVAAEPEADRDLLSLDIEQLLEVEVTSVSKKRERSFEAPAAVYVITQEDLRRSGHRTIPEALRMVPGLQVAQIDANHWSITSRGFNGRFANKLLVMIDGRSVYTPLFSGVFWKVQDTLLEDIERIEVIRGPGGTVWGANAVNGVINIITKDSRDTQGALVTTGAGTHERAFGSVRWGGAVGDDVHYRVYAKYDNRDDFEDSNGDNAHDAWDVLRGGFRTDVDASDRDRISFQGDAYTGDSDQTVFKPSLLAASPGFQNIVQDDDDTNGGNLMARWTHTFSETSDFVLGAYWDRYSREDSFVREKRNTLDLDFQHRFSPWENNELIWGLGYRWTHDSIQDSPNIAFPDTKRTDHLFSAFVMDEMRFFEDELRFTFGSKFEHNNYSGYEVQPSARLAWVPNENHTVWGSVSRAVRTPSRAESDFSFIQKVVPGPPIPGLPIRATVFGSEDFESEKLLAFEAGYRVRAMENLSFDLAGFYNFYDDVRTAEVGTPSLVFAPVPHLALATLLDNKSRVRSYGTELAANWSPTAWWRLGASYTFFKLQVFRDSSSTDITADDQEGDAPTHQLQLFSRVDLPWNLEFDSAVYLVENLGKNPGVEGYARFDFRLGWQPRDDLDVSLVVQNAFDRRHAEWNNNLFLISSEVPRSAYAAVTWRF